ncbi:YciI family protein [Amycolatopsis rhabdoformis]|uniref:YciI family protein n=1 Tax=Amycolatopsis rhabdoformis TaxID=1448059 RepID=A0ABZ1HU10_9PSEU|nr:YciI family protein [Amycolatopsis rhabdoformis]WSE25933.1 YciI family protein [Amycolatopsis rhabdoformis]
MKFLLTMHMNPEVWDALSEETREGVMAGHGDFIAKIRASGELVNTQALTLPSESAVVRVRGGVPAITDGPYIESKEFLAGFYLVECESKARALEVAAMIPDASIDGLAIEVRPVAFFADAESEIEQG